MSKWVVSCKGSIERKSYELSIVREDNQHGLISWGWLDTTSKLLISHEGGHGVWPMRPEIWERLKGLAQEICDDMNKADAS